MAGTGAGRIGLGLVLWLGLSLTLFPDVSFSQDPATESTANAILVIDQDRLFTESAFGKASVARETEAAKGLEAENAKIQADLIAEEQELTLLRKSLTTDEFSARAKDFDQKVERIRDEQDSKARALGLQRDEDVRTFVAAVAPILGEILTDRGAVVILDKATVILSLNSVDVTDEAIKRIDAVLVDPTSPP